MIAGRYSLEHEIGRGGMGAVWLGRDEVLGRPVALKRLGMPLEGSSPDLERAAREARLAARLNHPRVVAVFDLVREGNEHWLVMEYVEGSTLAQLVRDRGPLTPDQAAPVLGQVAEALAAAHAAGIVHRDVKPSNILVGPHGEVKLSDFGIARAEADATLTRTGMVTGSPAYLAPEVASGHPATEASDIWSLGATLFHALAGAPPYEVSENVLGALYRIVHEDPPRLPDAGWLSPLLAATMTHDPAERWPAARVREYLAAGPADLAPLRSSRAARTPRPDPDRARTRAVPAVPAAGARSRRRAPVLPLFMGLAVVALLAVVAVAIGRDAGDGGRPAAAETSAPRSPSPTVAPGPTAAGMRSFVENYLRTAAEDPEAGYAMLTPGFQDQSNGLTGYTSFWGDVVWVDAIRITEADPETLEVGYTYTYQVASGAPHSEGVRLRLAYDDGRYLIAAEA
ncbi:serine/threonine-protein kinase [Nocardioides pantholopis]|uniref:serine/threonine-protein kinase n=1 Tax=Nocardioides pantholopis TaxID=2483798 RepID=UPI0013DE2835|nr:serine/threonine-protein kinase [Nocardioides pantholopis]